MKGSTGDVVIVTLSDLGTLSKEQLENYMASHKTNSHGHEYTEWVANGWAILGKLGFYTGWWLTKKDAIASHCKDLGKTWAQCVKSGDKAVEIVLHRDMEKK